jgi:electron transfer flavoprotein alpha subunit
MNKFSTVWVFSDTVSRLADLMGGARMLGEQINVFVLSETDSATAFHLGADSVWHLSGKPEDRMIEDYADAMAATIRQQGSKGLVLLPNTRRGKLLAAKLGFRLTAAVSNDANAVAIAGDNALVKHMVYGGLAIGEETLRSSFAVITLSSGTFEPAQPDTSRSGVAQTVAWQSPEITVIRTATQARQNSNVDLDKARWLSASDAVSGARRISRWQQRCASPLARSWPVRVRSLKTKNGWNTNAMSAFLT